MRRAEVPRLNQILAAGACLDGDYLFRFQRHHVLPALFAHSGPHYPLAVSTAFRGENLGNSFLYSQMRAFDRVRGSGAAALARPAEARAARSPTVALGRGAVGAPVWRY